jgi:hypothetical protein
VRGTLEICEDKEVGRKLEILDDDDVTEAIDLGIDVVHLRRALSMVRECIEETIPRVLKDTIGMKGFF